MMLYELQLDYMWLRKVLERREKILPGVQALSKKLQLAESKIYPV